MLVGVSLYQNTSAKLKRQNKGYEMNKYQNKITGAIITIESVLEGKGWELISTSIPQKTTNEKIAPVQEKKRGSKKK